jgi:hypothetical protein
MAISGRKPNPNLRLVTGSHVKDRPPVKPKETASPIPGGPVEKPKKLKKAAAQVWDRFIARAHWLTSADGPKAVMFCYLTVEYDKDPTKMIASRIAQLRALQSELGFDQATRDRMGISIPTGRAPQQQDQQDGAKKEQVSAAQKYFD